MTDDRERLRHISEPIKKIEKHKKSATRKTVNQELVIVWLLHHLQVIGEASSRISKEFRKVHPEIPWEKIIGMRNILVHHYFEVDHAEVLSTVEADIPVLKKQIAKLLA